MKFGKLIAIVMLITSTNLFASEDVMKVLLETKGQNKGVCENLCNYACTTDYCVMINGEEVCKESCATVCEYICE